MTTAQMVTRISGPLLNRPSSDDFFSNPNDYYAAINVAVQYIREQIAQHWPELMYATATVASDADGDTYLLSDDHLGELEVWTPPGPPRGQFLPNVLPDSGVRGFYLEGRNIKLTHPQIFTPGLYVRWVPNTFTALSGSVNSPLPTYCDEAICLRAAWEMANKPGFLGNPQSLLDRFDMEWEGNDRSNIGVLGVISRQAAAQGMQTAAGLGMAPWYVGIR